VLRGLLWLVIGIAVLAGGVAVAARLYDGPLGIFAGGPFRSGEQVSGPVDWSFAKDLDTIQFQLLAPPRSRTTWILVHAGHAYIPCGMPSLRIWKQWPHEALLDGRAILRAQGRLYDLRLVKVEDAPTFQVLRTVLQAKYGGVPGETGPDDLWFFRLDPRS